MGAQLGDLVVAGRMVVVSGRLRVTGPGGAPADEGDEVAAYVVESVHRQADAHPVRAWIETFRDVLHDRALTVGWFVGARSELDGDLVLASVQKLSRPEHLAKLGPRAFDYVIVDEVHHAAAPSWRAVLDRLDPGFGEAYLYGIDRCCTPPSLK